MSKINAITVTKWSIATLIAGQAWLVGGCDDPSAADPGVIDEVDDEDRAWTGYTSEEYPPLICPNRYAVGGVDCAGDYCDNVSLDCRFTGRIQGEHTWLPYFSEEGEGSADEAYCTGNSMWLTGISCSGSYCDNISLRCSVLIGSSTGSCLWSGWYSEEQAPFVAPSGQYVKGVECDGSYCDNKRYYYCWIF